MRILAFETSAKAASVALMQDGKLLSEAYQNTGLTHSQTLLAMAQKILEENSLTSAQIDAIAVAAGPGSFTGVRIGVAAAKGFAWGREIPCCGVSTLEAMAHYFAPQDGYILPVMDARRAQVYTALFVCEEENIIRLTPDRAISLQELGEELKKLEEPIFLVGDGSVLCYNTLKDEVPNLICPSQERMHQRASGVAIVADRQLKEKINCDAAALVPNYLRLSQAERERLERQTS